MQFYDTEFKQTSVSVQIPSPAFATSGLMKLTPTPSDC